MNYKAKLLQIIKDTPRVKLFRLERADNFNFVPGQFVMISIDGFLDPKTGVHVKRSYSIASSPVDEYIELCISRAEPGLFSARMHELQAGAIVNVNGPYGVFKLKQPVPENTTFVAGGSGIAPIRSMIRTLQENPPRGMRLFYGFRNPEEFIYRGELIRYAQEHSLILNATIDKPADRWNGDIGFVTDMLPKYSYYNKTDVYICGPPIMVPPAIRMLIQLGFDEKRIYREQW